MIEYKQALDDIELALHEYRAKQHAQKQRERTAHLKAAGLCVTCGKVPTKAGYTYCKACLRRSYLLKKARRKAGQQTVREIEGQKRHNAKSYAKTREIRHSRAVSGLCIKCGTALSPGYSFLTCESCRKKAREANRRQRERRKKHADQRRKDESAGRVD